MMFGLSPEQWQILQNLVINPLKMQNAQVYIFGSRARKTQHPFSDIDILFKEKAPIPPAKISHIKESIEESALTIKVDLVKWEDLADSYREQVDREKIEV